MTVWIGLAAGIVLLAALVLYPPLGLLGLAAFYAGAWLWDRLKELEAAQAAQAAKAAPRELKAP